MKRLWWWIVGGCVAVGVVVMIAILLAPKSPVLPAVTKQLTSTLLLPKGQGIQINRSSVIYDSSKKLLSYNVAYADTKIVMSQQPTPESFTDIPQVYNKLTDSMNNYLSFDVNMGTVHLTLPKELQGKQVAVFNSKGTLLFAKPDKNLSNDEWKRFFNQLQVQD